MLKKCYSLPLMLLFLSGCFSYVHRQEEVQEAMQHYDRLIKKMDADSIAWMFTPDGDLGAFAHGRDSIRKFLSSFKNVRVLEQFSSTDSLAMTGDSAFQMGHYKQSDLANEKDTFHVSGTYRAHWLWVKHDGWRIRKMTTQPDNLSIAQ